MELLRENINCPGFLPGFSRLFVRAASETRLRSIRILLVAVVALVTMCGPAQAQTLDVYEMGPPGGIHGTAEGREKWCNKRWNLLWPKAQEGDEEARFILYTWVTGFMHAPRLVLPGRAGDRASRIRDKTILAVFSWNYMVTIPEGHPYEAFAPFYREKVALDLFNSLVSGPGSSAKFTDCVNRLSGNCSKEAVDENLVPPFGAFAEQINTFLKAGDGPSCVW
ncbi:hypothetical protein [Iodidimonas muriae]|nr:hypothetical protein [Iodidimonas muriae]